MIHVNVSELKERPELPSPLYGIHIEKKPLTMDEVRAAESRLYRLKLKYPYISYFIAPSVTVGETAIKHKMPRQKGLPKTIVEGEPEDLHAHIGIMGIDGHSANTAANIFVERTIDSFDEYVKVESWSRGTGEHAWNFIAYSHRQSIYFRQGKKDNFNFKIAEDIRYYYPSRLLYIHGFDFG